MKPYWLENVLFFFFLVNAAPQSTQLSPCSSHTDIHTFQVWPLSLSFSFPQTAGVWRLKADPERLTVSSDRWNTCSMFEHLLPSHPKLLFSFKEGSSCFLLTSDLFLIRFLWDSVPKEINIPGSLSGFLKLPTIPRVQQVIIFNWEMKSL